MKIAIPTFATRVSPRFDCARSILVVTVENGETSERQELTASDWPPHERIKRLLELGVDTVICGGIDCWSAASLLSVGVTVYGWMTGEVEDALEAMLQGTLDSAVQAGNGNQYGCRRFPGDDEQQDRSIDSQRGWKRQRGRGGPGGPEN